MHDQIFLYLCTACPLPRCVLFDLGFAQATTSQFMLIKSVLDMIKLDAPDTTDGEVLDIVPRPVEVEDGDSDDDFWKRMADWKDSPPTPKKAFHMDWHWILFSDE